MIRTGSITSSGRTVTSPAVQPGASRRQNSKYPPRSARTGQVGPSRPKLSMGVDARPEGPLASLGHLTKDELCREQALVSWCSRPADMTHQSQAFILDVSRGAAIGRVHDRYITSPRQVHDRLNQIQSLRGDTGKPLRHDAAARAASRSAGSVARHGAVPVFHPAGDARSVTASVAVWMDGAGLMWKPAPAAGTNKTSPPSVASRTAENRLPGMRGMHQSGEQSGGPRNGTKRTRIGKASGSTDRSFGPDAVRLPASPRDRKWVR